MKHYVERVEMVSFFKDGIEIGLAILQSIAKPETVRAKFGKNFINPLGYDDYGNPYFKKEDLDAYREACKETYDTARKVSAANGKKFKVDGIVPMLEISYEEDEVGMDFAEFDTVEGLTCNVQDLEGFVKVIQARKRFVKANPHVNLHKFVVLDKYVLDSFGEVWLIKSCEHAHDYKTVRTLSNYLSHAYRYDLQHIQMPTENTVCVGCGRKFTYEDIKDVNIYYDFAKGEAHHLYEKSNFERKLKENEKVEIA